MFRSLLLVLTGVIISGQGFAAELQSPLTVMHEIVVTATRQEEALSDVPANVTVVTEQEIAQSPAQTIPELLRSVPGVVVNDIAGNGRIYTIDLRGFGETASLNTLVLVDGRRINQADLSGVDWTLIPKDLVKRIEIVRGGRGSVLYGDNASGGVINIITKQGTGKLAVTGDLFAGSYDTYQGNALVSGSIDQLGLAVNGNYLDSDGYRDNSDTLAKDAGLSLNYQATDLLTLNFNSGYHKDDTSMPGGLFKSDLDNGLSRRATLTPDNYADTKDWYLQGGLQYYLTDDSYLDLGLSKRKRDATFYYFSSFGNFTGDTEIDTWTLSPQFFMEKQLFDRDTKILLGFDYEKTDEDITNATSSGSASYDMSRSSYGYFTHWEVAATENLALSGGVRKDRAKFDFKANEAGYSDSLDMSQSVYTLGANYQFMENSSVYASYAKSFRYPVIDEFFNFNFNTVNDSLNAQDSDDFEAGMRLQFDSGLFVGLNLFRIVTKDEIYFDPLTFANENLDGDSVRQGIELSASKEIQGILLRGSYTYRHTDIDGGQYDGNQMPNVPKHQFTVGALKTFFNRVQLDITGTFIGKRRYISDFDNSLGYQDDYFYLAGKLSYLLSRGAAYIAVYNILDQKYAEYGVDYGSEYLYPSPTINFVAGVNFRF
ncbi:MAG: TonB-dependent receptor [Desulfuromonadales bacterium]